MSEQNTAGASLLGKLTEQFNKMVQEQLGYAESMNTEAQKMREKNTTLMQSAAEDYTKMARAGMEFQTGMMSEMQKISSDMMRQSLSWMKPE